MFYFTVSVFYKGNVEKKHSVAFGFVKPTENRSKGPCELHKNDSLGGKESFKHLVRFKY